MKQRTFGVPDRIGYIASSLTSQIAAAPGSVRPWSLLARSQFWEASRHETKRLNKLQALVKHMDATELAMREIERIVVQVWRHRRPGGAKSALKRPRARWGEDAATPLRLEAGLKAFRSRQHQPKAAEKASKTCKNMKTSSKSDDFWTAMGALGCCSHAGAPGTGRNLAVIPFILFIFSKVHQVPLLTPLAPLFGAPWQALEPLLRGESVLLVLFSRDLDADPRFRVQLQPRHLILQSRVSKTSHGCPWSIGA